MSAEANYIGNELELFAHAINWKNYWGKKVAPFLGSDVLEVGAGIGTNTKYLLEKNPNVKEWICIEPDERLTGQIQGNLDSNSQEKVSIHTGYLKDYKTDKKFDSILYIDVIEHLKDDKAEIEYAKSLLNDDGHLIILVPAHNFLFSEFDKEIGHYRRYNKDMLRRVINGSLNEEKLIYLDVAGMASSVANKLFLKQTYPTLNQIKFWDNYIVRTSRLIDPLLGHRFGKSLLGIWKH